MVDALALPEPGQDVPLLVQSFRRDDDGNRLAHLTRRKRSTLSITLTALEEVQVNAVYHRGYDVREAIEVRLNAGSIENISALAPKPAVIYAHMYL
jgi:hypothetical protein